MKIDMTVNINFPPLTSESSKKGECWTPFGHNEKKISGKLDLLLMREEGLSFEQAVEELGIDEARWLSHLNDLREGLRNNGIPAFFTFLSGGRIRISESNVAA